MSQISNRFYVTALEDGTTLHGNLASDKSLTQAWNSSAGTATPDWTVTEEQPTIYLTLLSGATLVQPANGYHWYYNGNEISNDDPLFQKTTKSVTYAGQTVTMPALKIVGNLASSANVDMDLITFSGSYVISGSGIAFSCSTQVRITSITEGSSIGVINFVEGVSDIIEAGQTITMYGKLYGADGTENAGVTTKWYINSSSTPTSGRTITPTGSSTSYTNAFQVSEAQVVDHATIRCEFYDTSNNKLYTAYASVDDMQDPEFMYVQYNGANGNAASLRSGESASFKVWVGSRDDAAVRAGWENATYKVQLLDGDGAIITASGLSDIPNPDAGDTTNYYRTLNKGNDNKASFSIAYDTAQSAGKKNLTGIIIATV